MKDIALLEKKDRSASDNAAVNIYDFASVLVSAVVAIAFIFTFVFRVVGVVGTSMVPTLQDGDWLFITAGDPKPEYGQVIIITQPNWFDEPIVKRIIATENQTLDINFDKGEVYVDGVLLDEPYINNLTLNREDGVTFPLTVPEGVTRLAGWCFYNNSALTKVSLPDSLLSIGNKAFSGCTGFTEITFPQNLKRIGYSAFADCANITTLYLPASLEEIGRDAFLGCGELFFTVERDSYAAQYARDNNIEFTYSDINAWLNG